MRRRTVTVGIVTLLFVVVAVQWTRRVPPMQTSLRMLAQSHVPGHEPAIPWPKEGQAALAVPGVGWMGQHGAETAVPIASVAKLMTAYLVLHDHPLSQGQDGPTVTITGADVAEYQHDVATGQSCLRVATGEQLSERQLLEALLLPSANNAANILARFDAGSTTAFVAKMNATAKQFGMANTRYADASGVNPATVSTAVDQIRIAEQDMTNPTFVGIVARKKVTLPVAGVQYNVDYALGHDGIVGIKTGTTDQAGGCFVFATRPNIGGQHVLVVGAVLGQQPNTPINNELMVALTAGETLAQAGDKALKTFSPLSAGATVASLSVPWGQSAEGVVGHGVSLVGWPGLNYRVRFEPKLPMRTVQSGQQIGTLVVQAGEETARVPVMARGTIGRPPVNWRLERSLFTAQ
ncbi:D-alanyl-D-alanine carboxypeptidase family protein [Alicyclobacillus sp. ALC3]|uniref:D-alanyl-D-alanine carboxypeptidase family protein n=1 Tax=Alicyclobacillus sp. ALC3 TaxID=2796143 RepID=UPI002378BF24|nr:serine hydrolase [Alicyclobacillus sp. ALC3]WDL96287.1 D-alanyl-D-alanine carboxypeptidase [Alicyclobacillus sp. ALC3]